MADASQSQLPRMQLLKRELFGAVTLDVERLSLPSASVHGNGPHANQQPT